jgi:hypothetical protein
MSSESAPPGARHERPASAREKLVPVLLGVAWAAASIAAFAIGVAITGTSGPQRPGLPRWQEPGFGAVMVGLGALLLALAAGIAISLVRDRRRYGARYRQLRSLGYRVIPGAFRNDPWAAPIAVGFIVAPIAAGFIVLGLWLRHRYG